MPYVLADYKTAGGREQRSWKLTKETHLEKEGIIVITDPHDSKHQLG